MSDALHAILQSHTLPAALLAGLLASVASGVVGTYVVVRRITYIAGGIAHCVLGGMGVAYYLNKVQGWTWLSPLEGAVVAAILAALLIGAVSLGARQREDTIISALWAGGMATGILFIARTPGYYQDLMDFLFGTIILVPRHEMWLLAGLDLVVLLCGLGFYKQFLAVCFDEEAARLRGLTVEVWYLLLLCLTALTVILLVQVVGLILTIALLTLPVAIAGQFVHRLWKMMLLSTLLAAFFTTSGLLVSYGPELPAGAIIVAFAAGGYLASMLGAWTWRRLRRVRTA